MMEGAQGRRAPSGTPSGMGSESARAALLVGIVAAAVRFPFASHLLFDHDSVQFALGVEHFDLAAHHPHPPGYPLYIGLLKMLAAAGVSSLVGMVALSLLAGALGAGMSVLVAEHLTRDEPVVTRRAAGLLAAVFYTFNPMLWHYGRLPLVYGVEGGLVVALAFAALRMSEGGRWFFGSCALFGLAGGMRPSTLVLLSPLFLFGLWRTSRGGRLSFRSFSAGALVGAVAVALWALPLLAAAGGLTAYRTVSAAHFSVLLPQTAVLYGAGFGALRHNLFQLAKWAAQGLLPAVVAGALAWALNPGGIVRGWRPLLRAAPFLFMWVGPPVLFFALFHITKAGYTLVHLPALLLAAALGVAPAAGRDRLRLAAVAGLAALLGSGLFLFGSDRRPEEPRAWALVKNELNVREVTGLEEELEATFRAVRTFDAETTVLVTVELAGTGAAGADGFVYPWQRHLQWYLPEYRVLFLAPDEGKAWQVQGHRPLTEVGPLLPLPPATRRLLLVTSPLSPERLPLPAGSRRLSAGRWLVVREVPLEGEREVVLGRFELRLEPGSALSLGAGSRETPAPPG